MLAQCFSQLRQLHALCRKADFELIAIFRQSKYKIPGMTCICVDIVGFADESFPGFVNCAFADAHGNRQTFIEKIPVVTAQDLWNDSVYPQPGALPGAKVECTHDDAGRALAPVP